MHFEHPSRQERPPALIADVRLSRVNIRMTLQRGPAHESLLTARVDAYEGSFAGVPSLVYRQLHDSFERRPTRLANVAPFASVCPQMHWQMTSQDAPSTFGAEDSAVRGRHRIGLSIGRVRLGVETERGDSVDSFWDVVLLSCVLQEAD